MPSCGYDDPRLSPIPVRAGGQGTTASHYATIGLSMALNWRTCRRGPVRGRIHEGLFMTTERPCRCTSTAARRTSAEPADTTARSHLPRRSARPPTTSSSTCSPCYKSQPVKSRGDVDGLRGMAEDLTDGKYWTCDHARPHGYRWKCFEVVKNS